MVFFPSPVGYIGTITHTRSRIVIVLCCSPHKWCGGKMFKKPRQKTQKLYTRAHSSYKHTYNNTHWVIRVPTFSHIIVRRIRYSIIILCEMKRQHAPRNARHATIYHSTRGNIIVVTSFGGLKKSLLLRHTHARDVYVTCATRYRIVVSTSHYTDCVCVRGWFFGRFSSIE